MPNQIDYLNLEKLFPEKFKKIRIKSTKYVNKILISVYTEQLEIVNKQINELENSIKELENAKINNTNQ